MEAFLKQALPASEPPSPPQHPRSTRGAAETRRAGRSRTLQLAVVAFAFALLGLLTPGELRPEPGLPAAELGISIIATLMAVASLGRPG